MRLFTIFATIIIIVVAGVGILKPVREYVLKISLDVKEIFVDSKDSIIYFVKDYIGQADKIASMREQIRELESYKIKYKALSADFDNLYYATEIERHYKEPEVQLSQVLSYVTLGSYTKLWINYNGNLSDDKIFGMVKDGYAIGIARKNGNHLMGILNGDRECSYSVYIGDNRVPGTLRTMNDGRIVIDYIPAWQSIKVGDNVVTSGLDGIFFEDVQVGAITSVRQESGYQRAGIKLESFSNRLSYVWLIDTNIPQVTRVENTTSNNVE